jgi:EAL domain-containing protein (putative c-di-GMP-specific phosphodiesterase class I)
VALLATGVGLLSASRVRRLGCDSAQGFLMSPAIPASELRTWLADWHAQQAARVVV